MKRIVLLVVILMLALGNICSAEQWERISSNSNVDIYLDTSSVKSTTLDAWDILKCKVKVVYKTRDRYDVDTMFINTDTKRWALPYVEQYNRNDQLVDTSESNPKVLSNWNNYQNELWKPIVDKTIEISKESK